MGAKYLLPIILLLQGCASIGMGSQHGNCSAGLICKEGPMLQPSATEQLLNLPYPNQKTIVAVYQFNDVTGQRKGGDNIASFSTAVTQGAIHILIEAETLEEETGL